MNKLNPMTQLENTMDTDKPLFSFNENIDLEKYKKEALFKLNELLGMNLFEKTDENLRIEKTVQKSGYKQIRFVIATEKYFDMPCYLLVPDDVINPPLMVCLQGHSTGVHISLGEKKFEGDEISIAGGRDFGVQSVKNGFAALCVEMRYFGERKEHPDVKGPECWIPAMTEIMLGRTAVGGRVWDVMRALDAVCGSFDGIDYSRIAIMGTSGGGTAAWYAAALEPRIKALMPSCALCSFRKSIAVIKHCTCNHVPDILKYFEMGDIAGLIAPKPLVAIAGKNDEIFPIDGVNDAFLSAQKWYNLYGAGDSLKLVVGNKGHQFYPEEAWPVFKETINW